MGLNIKETVVWLLGEYVCWTVVARPGGHSRWLFDEEEHNRLQWKQENKVIGYVINEEASCRGYTVAERSAESL